MSAPWRLVVKGLHRIRGHGLVAAGKMDASEEPKLGPIVIWRPDGTTESRKARAFERYAIPIWWHNNVGVLLDGDGDVPIGSILEEVRQ